MSLLGKLVEIINLRDVVEPTQRMLEIDPNMRPLQVNGEKGWAVEWVSAEQRYQIETFNGDFVSIPEENLQEYDPPLPTAGGFDVAWPAAGLEDEFEACSSRLAQALMDRSFCVTQMTNVREQSMAGLRDAMMRDEWSRILPEFETAFLGNGSLGKISWLQADASQDDMLGQADKVLTGVASMLAPYSQFLGFALGSRSAGLLRMPFENEEEGADLMRGTNPEDQVSGREIEGCLQFTKLKKIGMIYFVHGNGGTVTLHNKDPTIPPVQIPVEEGRLLLFRHDLVNYSYAPKGTRNLVIQAWIFREERAGEMEMVSRAGQSAIMESWDKDKIPTAPSYGNSKETVDIMSVGCRLPCEVNSAEDLWGALHTGADGLIPPTARWDNTLYYDANTKAGDGSGKMYCNHLGMLSSDVFIGFDCDFFDMTAEEALQCDPATRTNLEVGYECMMRGGWSKETLRDTEIAFTGGLSQPDFMVAYIQGKWPDVKPTAKGWFDTTSINLLHDRIPFALGLRGPAFYFDTACSSGLTSVAAAHALLRPQMPGQRKSNSHRQLHASLSLSSNSSFEPGSTIALCGAGMITHNGRCFTFDSSADGYVRAEGICALHMQVHKSEVISRMSMLAGSGMNQDGKSASMTAPNGPSQTAVTKLSLREAGITAFDIQTQELHGTGTPLGDPIEVGALRAAMMSQNGVVRDLPLVKTSSKSAVGHGELNAGMTGIIKCTLMLMFSAATPGLHLRLLNPNMDSGGYPVIFNPEIMDTGKVSDNCGVSSFGFSGCNARADVWGMATVGPRKVLPIGLNFSAERHRMFGLTKYAYAGRGGTRAELGAETTEGFDGIFSSGHINDDTELAICGSWSLHSKMDPLDKVPEMSTGDMVMYQGGFRVGETLVEEFCIHVDGYVDNIIFPSTPSAGQNAMVLGPGTAPKGYNWRIDGRADGAQAGTIYIISLWWYPLTQQKRVTWEMMEDEIDLPFDLHDYTHRYSVKGSFTTWICQEMQPIGNNTFEMSFKIGNTGHEEFQFSRDDDDAQLIYPTESTLAKTSVPIAGPDGNGRNKHWKIMGSCGSPVKLQLTIADGQFRLAVTAHNGSEKVWESLPVGTSGRYFLADFNGRCVPMEKVADGVHRFVLSMTERDSQAFQIRLDQDPGQAIYPELNDAAYSGLSSALGPDSMGQDTFWQIQAEEGSRVEITLDTNQVDPRQIVTWKEVSGRSLEDGAPIGLFRPDDDDAVG